MTELITQNAKLKKTSKLSGLIVKNFGITASESNCTFAGICKDYCYAKKGTFTWSNVKPAYDWRGELTRKPMLFYNNMWTAIRTTKFDWLRIHDSGDYYGLKYILQWFDIIKEFPNRQFYSYTKAVKLFKRLARQGRIPANFTTIYSYGGIEDHLIDPTMDRHATVFRLDRIRGESVDEWKARMDSAIDDAGYSNASDNDLVAPTSDNHRIGLRFH